jgi:hypothetical protein
VDAAAKADAGAADCKARRCLRPKCMLRSSWNLPVVLDVHSNGHLAPGTGMREFVSKHILNLRHSAHRTN